MEISSKILSDITIYTKYAKFIKEKNRRETWSEIIDRNKEMHIQKFPELKDEIEDAYKMVYDKKILPSMRSLQFAGKPIKINNSRIYNCSFLPMNDIHAFSELMFLLLSGVGVGYSVQRKHIKQLPEIRVPTKSRRYLVGDSIEGWSDSIKTLMRAYFEGKPLPVYDFSDIRPKGARLITSGGKAPGPEPLKDCLHNVKKILDRKQNGERLTTLEVHDINCYIADAVLSGGIRRSAMIALFDLDDDAMLTSKFDKWYEANPQRGRANNSAVIVRHKIDKKTFIELWQKIKASGTGEPGFFFTNDAEWGLNPCVTGDTMVAVADGRGYVSFEELAKDGVDVPVYTLNESGTIVSEMMRRPRLSAKNVDIYAIELDDGSIIKTTANHKFPLMNGEIKETKDLVAGDAMRIMTKFDSPLWNKKNSQEYTFIRSMKQTRAEHRIIAEQHYGVNLLNNSSELTVHHKDFNSKNNSPSNLEIMTTEKHNELHKQRMVGQNNPVHKVLQNRRKEYAAKISDSIRGEKNPNYCGYSNDQLREFAIQLTKELNRPATLSDWVNFAKSNGLPQHFSSYRGNIRGLLKFAAISCGFEWYEDIDARTIKRLYYYLSNGYDCFVENGTLLFNKICEVSGEPFVTEYPEASVKHEYAAAHRMKMEWMTNKSARIAALRNSHESRKQNVRSQQTKIFNDLKSSLNREPSKKEWNKACRKNNISIEISRPSSPFRYWDDLKTAASVANHRVKSVSYIGKSDVYNGTVDKYHNYFIGKFVGTQRNGKPKIVSINTLNCAEISLRPFQFCNLVTINAATVENQEDLNLRAKSAAFIATLQASYTDFHYLRDIWKETTEKEALIGVSLTGIASHTVLDLNLSVAAEEVKKENERVAKLIGINKAARTTTVKPEGTTSLVVGSSSGIHAWHNEYYVRRMRLGKNEAIYTYLSKKHKELLEDDYFKPNQQSILSIPQKAPARAITRDESALELLTRVKHVWEEWVQPGHRKGNNVNNVSTTVTIKDSEWQAVGDWMWENRNMYTALSVLPYDGHSYIQPPFEDITKKRYDELMESLKEVDLTKVVELDDNTTLADNIACGGGACEII